MEEEDAMEEDAEEEREEEEEKEEEEEEKIETAEEVRILESEDADEGGGGEVEWTDVPGADIGVVFWVTTATEEQPG